MLTEEEEFDQKWQKVVYRFIQLTGKKPNLNTILFLIGIQEFGNIKKKFTKEQKQDLMHVAVCALLAQSGYYKLEGLDADGWPHFIQLKELPVYDMMQQEIFLKDHVLLYFDNLEKLTNV